MKKHTYLLFTLIIILASVFFTNAQTSEKAIVIKSNSIEVPNIFDFGNIEQGGQVIEQIIIKNNTQNIIDIKNLKAPSGYIVSVSKTTLKPNSKTTLIIGLDSNCVKEKGRFTEQVIIETNLIQNIVIDIKGIYL